MNFCIHHFFHSSEKVTLEGLNKKLDQIIILLTAIQTKEKQMSEQLNALLAEVADVKTVVGEGVAKLADLQTKLDAALAAGSDTAALQGISDDLAAAIAPMKAIVEPAA